MAVEWGAMSLYFKKNNADNRFEAVYKEYYTTGLGCLGNQNFFKLCNKVAY